MNIKEIIKKINKDDFFEKVNLHIHSCCSDGKMTPYEVVEQAKKLNMKYIAICDHNTLNAYLNSDITENSDILIPAIEFDCWFQGVLIHLLGYGVDIHNKYLQSLCAKDKRGTEADIVRFFTRRSPIDVINAIHEAGGVSVLAHPACYWCLNLEKFVSGLKKIGLDGIEAYYSYRRHRGIIKFHKTSTPLKIAKKLDLLITGGTDEHGVLVKEKILQEEVHV